MNSIRLCEACKLEDQMQPETVMESSFYFHFFFPWQSNVAVYDIRTREL